MFTKSFQSSLARVITFQNSEKTIVSLSIVKFIPNFELVVLLNHFVLFLQGEHIIDAACFADTIYVCSNSSQSLSRCTLRRNSVGFDLSLENTVSYDRSWEGQVHCIAAIKDDLLMCHKTGALLLSRSSLSSKINIPIESPLPVCAAPFKSGFLYTAEDKCKIFYWDGTKSSIFAGGESEGSKDGSAEFSRFYNPSGLAVEFDNVVYVSDYSTGSIRILTTLSETSKFLKALGNLADAFSIHESKQEFKLQSLPDAILLVERCVEVIQKNTDLIRENDPSLPKSLNGPEGSVSAVSLESLHIVLWALKRLGTISATYNIKGWNLLSCVTLDVENLHSSVNQQQGVQTMLSYAQSFASSVKEALKRTTQWAAYYFTSIH